MQVLIKSPETDERVLFLRIAAGNEEAFTQLFFLYKPLLLPVVRNIVGPHVKDIVQEVFLDIWLHRSKLPAVENPRHWIFRVTYNRCYGWVEKQMVRDKAQKKLAATPAFPAAGNMVEESLTFKETATLLQKAIQNLPAQSQHIYTMSRNEGLNVTEIAARLNMAPQSVSNSLYRSAVFIRQYLAKKGVVLPALFFFQIFFNSMSI